MAKGSLPLQSPAADRPADAFRRCAARLRALPSEQHGTLGASHSHEQRAGNARFFGRAYPVSTRRRVGRKRVRSFSASGHSGADTRRRGVAFDSGAPRRDLAASAPFETACGGSSRFAALGTTKRRSEFVARTALARTVEVLYVGGRRTGVRHARFSRRRDHGRAYSARDRLVSTSSAWPSRRSRQSVAWRGFGAVVWAAVFRDDGWRRESLSVQRLRFHGQHSFPNTDEFGEYSARFAANR